MRKLIVPVALVAGAMLTFFLPNQKEDNPYLKTAKLPKQDRIDLAIQYEYEITKDPSLNAVPRERLLTAEQVLEARLNTQRPNGAVTGITWQERGPNNVGGRTRALIFDLNDAANGYKKIWAGGVGGGLWYTNDITAATPTWNKVNDFMENLAITSIAQNPANPQEIYVGTGEGWFNSDAIRGLGIWKTTNGGSTWTQLASTNNSNFYYVQKIVIDGTGKLYVCTRDGGLQKSTNGGTSWTKILGTGIAGCPHNNAADVEIAANGNIYCSFGIFSTGKIYRSTDEGSNWNDITPASARRIELACAPSDDNTVYALFQSASTNDCNAIQRYNASSNTWTACTVPTIIDQGSNSNFTRGQAWYDLVAAVDPNNADRVYIGGVDALRSDNGGSTWTQMTTWSLFNATGFTSAQNVHADQHAIVYAPGSSSRAIWGTDGGVDYTANADVAIPSKPIFVDKNNGYNVTQYYACAIHPTNTNYFLAGAQDNGTQKFTTAGINSTTNASGGDGAFCHIDQDNPNIQITSYVYNNYYISTNGGTSFTSRSFANTGGFINPTDYDDAANIMYGGNTAGSYFRWNDPATGGTSWNNVTCAEFGTNSVRHVLVSKTVANRVYFGLSNGSVVMVDNANTGTSVTGTVIRTGTGSVSGIAIDPANENHMLVSYSNYGVTSVWESNNAVSGSPTWTAVEGNLPDMPVRWVMFDPRNTDWALIATELGVWSTDNLNGAITDWQPTNAGFANVRVDMLQHRASDNTIAAATHGRGLFTAVINVAPPPPPVTLYVDFATATANTTEQTVTTNGCRRYRDFTVDVTISGAPTSDATVTYTLEPSSTASSGLDFEFTTNGSFSSPSTTHTFATGVATNKTVTIRVYDDAVVDPAESFVIRFAVSGNNAVQARNNTYTVSIVDNDSAPSVTTMAASGLGTLRTEFLAGNTDVYYYDNGQIMARVRNLSSHNFGCTDVRIDRAGTGASQFWNTNPANYLMNKTFKIDAATNNATGNYEVTLYFTNAEKAGWEAATGQSWNNIQLIKLPGAVSNVTPTNPQPDGPNSIQVVTPTRGTFANGHTLTATFSNGFSGFGAGVAGRMQTTLNLTGQLQTNGDIKLDWTTSAEINSTKFEIEKSYDGVNFKKIGEQAAAGTKYTPSSYSYTDIEKVQLNYFRIRMLHSDGHVQLSNVVNINNTYAPDRPMLLTNPFVNQLMVRFARVIQGNAVVSLYDGSGKLVHQSIHPGTNSLMVIDINTKQTVWSRGVYLLEIYAENKRHVFKVRRD